MKRAKILLTAGLLLGGGATAETRTEVIPQGAWPECETSGAPNFGVLCAGFVPGQEAYIMIVYDDGASPVRQYTYTATAVLLRTQQIVTISGSLTRDNVPSTSSVPLNFGGIVGPISVHLSSTPQESPDGR